MKMISIHEYELQPGSDPQRFEQAFRDAEARGLFDLPGLMAHHFVKGIKGARRNAYAAVWVYESREAWERLWGTLETAGPCGVSGEMADLGRRASCPHPERPSRCN